MRIAIGNDHAAVDMKKEIMQYLIDRGHEVVNVGCDTNESYPYAVSGYKVGKMVSDGEVEGGVLICGTGIGISMAANKVDGVRACACSDALTAHLSKLHNNANIVAFGARIVGMETAKSIVDAWLDTEFEGGRHEARIAQIHGIEKGIEPVA